MSRRWSGAPHVAGPRVAGYAEGNAPRPAQDESRAGDGDDPREGGGGVVGHALAVEREPRLRGRHYYFLQEATDRALGLPAAARYTQGFYEDFTTIVLVTCFFTLVLGSGLAVLGGLARMIARAQVQVDPRLPRSWLRAWLRRGRRRRRRSSPRARPGRHLRPRLPGLDALPARTRAAPCRSSSRRGDARDDEEGYASSSRRRSAATRGTSFEIAADEIAFDAVAVTRETLAAVGLFSTVMLGSRRSRLLRLF